MKPRMISSVAILSGGEESYGVGRNVVNLIRGFQQIGVKPIAIAFTEGNMRQMAEENDAEFRLAGTGRPANFGSISAALGNLSFMVAKAPILADVLRETGADAVLVQPPYLAPIVARASNIARLPSYWLMPNLVSSKYPLRLNARVYDVIFGLHKCTVVANSACTQRSLVNIFSRSYCAYLGIDPQEFSPNTDPAPRGDFAFEVDDIVFGIFARLVPFKGQLEFIEALAMAASGQPNVKLLICGGPTEGQFYAALKARVKELGLDGRVVIAGPSIQLKHNIAALYAMCDVIVNSRLDAEPFGLSVIEGMLMSKPLLVHALGGPAETVRDGVDGWHAYGPSPLDFAEAIRRALSQRSAWESLGEAGRKRALSEFTHIQMASRLKAIMEL